MAAIPPLSENAWKCKPDNRPTLDDAIAYIRQAHEQGRVYWRLDTHTRIDECSEYPTPNGERLDVSVYPPNPCKGELDFDAFCKLKTEK